MAELSNMQIADAARHLWSHWEHNRRCAAIPEECRPTSRADGYRIGAEIARLSGMSVIGWKIAATSAAGQKHINVDGPLAGRLLSGKVAGPETPVILGDNIMKVAELEFAFRFAQVLPPRREPYGRADVMAAVGSLHLSMEVPDSRYSDFTKVGAAQLIADTACAHALSISEPVAADWRAIDLSRHRVAASVNGGARVEGSGAAALGDPRDALTWLVNEVAVHAGGIRAGDLVTTGTCVIPVAVRPGDSVTLDYGSLGTLKARIV